MESKSTDNEEDLPVANAAVAGSPAVTAPAAPSNSAGMVAAPKETIEVVVAAAVPVVATNIAPSVPPPPPTSSADPTPPSNDDGQDSGLALASVKEKTVGTNSEGKESTAAEMLDPADAVAIEELGLGRRYPKRPRQQLFDTEAVEKEKKDASKKKKKEEEEAAIKKNVPPQGPPPDSSVGRYVEQSKLLGTTTWQFYPLNGQIVEYRPAEGRIPNRYAVQWEHPKTDSEMMEFIQEDEWVEEDLAAFEESVAKGSAPIMTYSAYKSTSQSHHPPPLKVAIENVRQRYQQVVVRDLQDSHLLSTLIVVAALEEALHASLQQQQELEANAAASGTTTTKKSSKDKPRPPLYYTATPSSYLQQPSADNATPPSQSQNPKVQMTPTALAQRLRQGCQWAWAYAQSKQEPMPLLKAPIGKRVFNDVHANNMDGLDPTLAASAFDTGSSVAQRRSVRATRIAPISYGEEEEVPRSTTRSAPASLEDPNPVQRGGCVAMWWMKSLEGRDAKKGSEAEYAAGDCTIDFKPSLTSKPTKKKNGEINGLSKSNNTTEGDDVGMATDSFEDDEPDEDAKDDDDEYTGGGGDQEEDDESLEGVEKERGKLSPVQDPEEAVESDEDVKEEEEQDEEHAIVWDNPYLKSSLPAFLEFLARPKSIVMEDIQKAMDEIILKIKHNKRSADNGIDVPDLCLSDKVVLAYEIPDHPSKGKVVLKCVSGETAGELQRLDANTFSRCKFELDVIGEEEKAVQIRRKEDLLQQEIEFKERKAWDRWRFRGIQEGYGVWPTWEEAAIGWVKENIISEDSVPPDAEIAQGSEETGNDEALAKSLEIHEAASGSRRRTARRAAATATEGVFYGNQSQLTQKQLIDALLRLVKASPFQTLMKLQSLVTEDSSDPIRRCRIALGKMLWKRNLIARKSATSQIGDMVLQTQLDSSNRLVDIKSTSEVRETESSPITMLLDYISSLQQTELKLRSLILDQLSEIPIPVVATAADERDGSLESLDNSDFDDITTVQWESSGHPLLNIVVFRPPTQSTLGIETTECNWYKVVEFSKSIKSEEEDAEDEAMERRTRFRMEPTVGPNSEPVHDGDVLILTEAQVHAGAKAAELQYQQQSRNSLSNPFARVSGDRVSLVQVGVESGDSARNPSFSIRGRIVAHDSKAILESTEVQYRILVLPDTAFESKQQKEAFWADLDMRAEDGSYVCRPEGQTAWYAIENQDFHQDSEAYNECEKILNWLSSQSKAAPFTIPVDPVALGIPSYPQIVKHPMDISTIIEKLEKGQYASIPPSQSFGQSPSCRMLNGPFRKDIELMFDNAALFNPPDDWIHQAAVSLKKSTIRKIETASSSAERSHRYGGGRQKHSLYVFDDSDQDQYEYESDNDDEYGGGRRRKRKRDNRGSTNKDEAAARAMEHSIRLHHCLKDGNDLRGPFAGLAINTDIGSFSLPFGWSCRKRIASSFSNEDDPDGQGMDEGDTPDGDQDKQEIAREMADLVALHKALGETDMAGLRRSTRAHNPSDGVSNKKTSKMDDLEYFFQHALSEDPDHTKSPKSRQEVESLLEERHEEYYSRLYFQFEKDLVASGQFGSYTNGAFPPYLGRIFPSKNKYSMVWEIRSSFAVPAIRWVLRGLIHSGHLTAVEPMTNDITSGVVIKNDIYYWDPKQQPFEVLDARGLQRRKRSDAPGEEESDDDFEMSEYEKARAERVARNAERLRLLGLT